jgi:GNAT superfamily N-acetyltransferase
VFLRDDAGRIVGGAYGRTNWNWLHIATVWVAETARGKGLGRRVMLAIEGAAEERAASVPISVRSAIRHARSTRSLDTVCSGSSRTIPRVHSLFLRKQLKIR